MRVRPEWGKMDAEAPAQTDPRDTQRRDTVHPSDKQQVRAFYDTVGAEYGEAALHPEAAFAQHLHETLLGRLRGAVRGQILDVGCNTQRPVPGSVGLDLSPVALKLRQTSYPASRNICGDLEQLPFADASFAAVFAGLVVDHLPAPAEAFRELHRVTRPGAPLVLTFFDPAELPPETYDGRGFRFESRSGRIWRVPVVPRTGRKLTALARETGWRRETSPTPHPTGRAGYRLLEIRLVREMTAPPRTARQRT